MSDMTNSSQSLFCMLFLISLSLVSACALFGFQINWLWSQRIWRGLKLWDTADRIMWIWSRFIQKRFSVVWWTWLKRASTAAVWLGLRHSCTVGIWFWVSGETVCYQNWAPGNGTSEEDCEDAVRSGAVQSGGDQRWISRPEHHKLNFICSTY